MTLAVNHLSRFFALLRPPTSVGFARQSVLAKPPSLVRFAHHSLTRIGRVHTQGTRVLKDMSFKNGFAYAGGGGRLKAFLAMPTAVRLSPSPPTAAANVPARNLQDFRPPNERASVPGSPPKTAASSRAPSHYSSHTFLRVRQRTWRGASRASRLLRVKKRTCACGRSPGAAFAPF